MKNYLAVLLVLVSLPRVAPGCAAPFSSPHNASSFTDAGDGSFKFDTGVLRGVLRPGGKSLGLVSVVHVPSGMRIDSSNGLLSHYRVFEKGMRHGVGAWDWASAARLKPDGTVEVHWPAAPGRLFEMRAVYRWHDAITVELETSVEPQKDLPGFELFVASYFSASFTNCAVRAVQKGIPDGPAFTPVALEHGVWQMFPRSRDALQLIEDGRWNFEPHPVDWTIRPPLVEPIGVRRDPVSGLAGVMMSPSQDCFAISSPHQGEGHRSLYFSLFGRDLTAGKAEVARLRLIISVNPSDDQIACWNRSYREKLAESAR